MITLTLEDPALEGALYSMAAFNGIEPEQQALRALREWAEAEGLLAGHEEPFWIEIPDAGGDEHENGNGE